MGGRAVSGAGWPTVERGEMLLREAEAMNPGPWRINAHYSVAQTGQVFSGISHYAMGINRNRQYDEVMSHYWGPYEVVDGSQYPNPWGLPAH